MLGTYPLSTLPLSTLESVEVIVVPPVVPPTGGGGGWYAPRREPPRPKKRQPVAYSVSVGRDTAKVSEGSVSFSISRTVEIGTDRSRALSGVVVFTISRTVRVGRAAAAVVIGECSAEIVRDPIPDRPLDTRLASAFACRATPLDIDNLILAMRREARRISTDLESGTITATKWAKRMRALIRSAHVTAATVGRGGVDLMRSGDWRRVDSEIAFADLQLDGLAKLARVRGYALVASRSRRFADAIRTSHDDAKHAVQAESAQ